MGYASWSVVFGEQPSAAKWNILGTNDAEFNSMIVHTAGGLTTLNDIRYQRDDSNSITSETKDNVMLQFGWFQISGDGTDILTETITFPTEFTTVLWAQVVPIARATSATVAATSIGDLTVGFSSGAPSASFNSLTTTGMTARLHRSSGTFTSGAEYGGSWMAMGTKT